MSGVTVKQVCDWMETLTITEGSLADEPLKLLPFQKKAVKGILSHKETALSMARGNGKTALSAALACAYLAGPLARQRSQIMIVAASLQQARVCFEHISWFLQGIDIRASAGRAKVRWRFVDNSHHLEIQDRETGIALRCVGSDSGRAHGRAPTLIIADEPAKWPRNEGPRMYAALRTSLGKQPGARMVCIGTRPDPDRDPDHWFARLLAGGVPGVYVQCHAADRKDDPFAYSTIKKANPAIEHIPELKSEVMEMRDRARDGGPDESMYLALYLNLGTPEVEENEVIVSPQNWGACTRPPSELPAPRGPVAIGLDLGGSKSMTAAALYWPEVGLLETYGAFPAEPGLQERGREDGVGERYATMERRGEIQTFPGVVTPVGAFITQVVLDRVEGHTVMAMVADRYRQKEVEQALAESSIRWKCEWRGTGSGMDGAADVRAFQTEVLQSRVMHAPSLAMESALADSVIRRDRNGNPFLDKSRRRGKIDVLQAAIHAVGKGHRWRNPDKKVVQRKASDYILPGVAMQKDPERPFPITRPLVRK